MLSYRALLIGGLILGLVLCSAHLALRPREQDDRGAGTSRTSEQRRSAPAGDRPAATNVDELSALRDELASLRAELARQRRDAPAKASSPSASSPPDSGVRPSGFSREDAARELQARIAVIDSAFQSEHVDPTWSASASSAIQRALSSEDVGGLHADSVDCRSQTCRVELHDDGSGRLGKSMPVFALQLAGTLPTITASTVPQSSGGSTLVLYLSRQAQAAQAR
jgi:hypothetical protein